VRDLVRELALVLREQVLPHLGSHAGRAHGDAGAGGDVTFAIDEEAERTLERFLAERAPELAFYSEDRGLVAPSDGASSVLVVDPIDGTRPALAGLEGCCVSVAAAPLRDGVTMGEVEVGCVVEIRSGAVFLAERGGGLVESPPVLLSPNERVDRMFWAYGLRGRPARATIEVLCELIDAS
jgi:myo-inositol-1(or 4)-monophosphatase